MRFITQFELVSHIDEKTIDSFKANGQFELGRGIADLFDWQKVPFRDTRREQNFNKWSLEIEAFPMDKWGEFRQRLIMECGMPHPDGVEIRELLSELESFGKPAGEAKELNH